MHVPDALLLDETHPRFGGMAEIAAFTRAGFSDDLPLLAFRRKFASMRHPFYRKIYSIAATIDRQYADMMDTCIIK